VAHEIEDRFMYRGILSFSCSYTCRNFTVRETIIYNPVEYSYAIDDLVLHTSPSCLDPMPLDLAL